MRFTDFLKNQVNFVRKNDESPSLVPENLLLKYFIFDSSWKMLINVYMKERLVRVLD